MAGRQWARDAVEWSCTSALRKVLEGRSVKLQLLELLRSESYSAATCKERQRIHQQKLKGLPDQNLTSRISTSRSCHSGLIFSVVCLEIGESRAQSSNEDCLRGYTCEHTWTRVEADDNMAQYLTHVITGASEYFNSQTEMEFLLRYPNEDDIRSCERVSRSLYRPVSYTKGSSAFQ